MATQTDPVEQLAAIVNRLYALAGSDGVSPAQKVSLSQQADALADELGRLVQLQLDQTAAQYTPLMNALSSTTDALNQAEAKIDAAVANIAAAAAVAASIDGLVQQAVALGTSAAKFA
jgi:hypothetical protein